MSDRIERIELWHVNVPMAAPFWPSWIPGYPQTHVVQTYARFLHTIREKCLRQALALKRAKEQAP